MSKENVQAFFQKADQDPVLKEKAQAILEGAPEEIPTSLSQLSTQTGIGFTADEFITSIEAKPLSDAELNDVAGGIVWHRRVKKDPDAPSAWDKIKSLFD